jgi:hypothetical protein
LSRSCLGTFPCVCPEPVLVINEDLVYYHMAHKKGGVFLHRSPFLRHLYIKCIFLPRQARDKHRESTQKGGVFRTALQRDEVRSRPPLALDHACHAQPSPPFVKSLPLVTIRPEPVLAKDRFRQEKSGPPKKEETVIRYPS